MKIALLHYSAPPVVGGVESVVGHQARLLADSGYFVRIIAGRGALVDRRTEFLRLPLADSRNDEILAVKALLDLGQVPDKFPGLVSRLVDSLSELLAGMDCLIAHNVCSLNKNLVLTAALYQISLGPRSPRIILWHHDFAWTTPRYRAELHDGYPWDLLRSVWPHATHVTVSEFRRNELAALFHIAKDEIHVVPNGVDVAAFLRLEKQTQEYVDRLRLLLAFPILLLPARITPRKNIELALHVLARLREHFPQAALVVTGPPGPHNPENRSYLAKLIALRDELGLSGAAHFLAELSPDFLPDEVVSDFYRLADILFIPSREEGFGIPLLEAGLSGIPVFCSDIPPLRELGEPFAALFPLDADPETIARMIVSRLSNDPVMGLRERVRSRYIWDRILRKDIIPLLGEV